MSIKILSRIRNRFNPVRSYGNGRLTIPSLIFILYTLLTSVNTSHANGDTIDWSILSASDTLVVFFNEVRVGMLYSKTSIDSSNRVIKLSTKLSISPDIEVVESFSGVEMNEMRKFDFTGNPVSAFQEMKSQSGTAIWKLEKKEMGKLQLTITAGGMTNSTHVEKISDNLKTGYAILEGIHKKELSVGQEWKDTLFELTAAKNIIFTIKCIAVPDKNNANYIFLWHNDLTGIDIRNEIDTKGRLVLQDVPPIFVARRYSADNKMDSDSTQPKAKVDYLYELVNIPIDRAQKSNETIALCLKSGTKIHKSVMRFYEYRNNKYVVKKLEENSIKFIVKKQAKFILL